MNKISNLGIIDIKWGKNNIPNDVDDITLKSMQLGGSNYSAELQEILIQSLFVVKGGYIIAVNNEGHIPFQRSEYLQLGKIPGGKHEDAALEQILADMFVTVAPIRHFLEKMYVEDGISGRDVCSSCFDFDQTIIDSTPDNILETWLSIVAKPAPRDIDALKQLAQQKEARYFIAHWLDIEQKAVRDFIKKSKGMRDEEYQDMIDEKEKTSNKKRRNTYEMLLCGKNETTKEAAIREYKEETGYEIDEQYVTQIGVIYETKITEKGTKYLKERAIYSYDQNLGEQGRISYSESENKQKLKLVTNKISRELHEMMHNGLKFKLSKGKWRERFTNTHKQRTKKLSSAVVTYLIMSWYNNIYQKSENN